VKIFVSHVSNNSGKRTAVRFKALIQEGSSHAQVFLSSDWDSIPSGETWMQAIEKALRSCDHFIALISDKEDAKKPWVNYEVGFACGRGLLPKVIIFSGIPFEEINYPLQGIHLLGCGDTNRWLRELSQMGLTVSKDLEKKFASLFEHR
jgi:TIR domain